jgi:hypothetical protein
MGGSSYSEDFYNARKADRVRTATTTFAYSAAVVSKPRSEQRTHALLDPKNKLIRESRDSAAHPESLAVAVMFDVTGSMSTTPKSFQEKLPRLMNLLTENGVQHPQLLFGCVGDARSDKGSIQIGEFESGNEMDETFSNVWLEAGGGGTKQESYQNALYFFARHTQIDCVEKRNKKGYLFLLGDEEAYLRVSKREVEALFGETLQEDIPLEQIIAEAQEKYNVFFIIPAETSGGRDSRIRNYWVKLFDETHVLALASAEGVAETIALTVGLCEGTTDLDRARQGLATAGVSGKLINDTVASLTPLAESLGKASTSSTIRL